MEPAVKTYLNSGKDTFPSESDLIAVVDKQIRDVGQKSPREAVLLARNFVSVSEAGSRQVHRAALRTLGWACRLDGKFDDSVTAYLSARKLYPKEPIERALIDRMLIDIYMYLGRHGEARKRMRMAINGFSRQSLKDEIIKTELNWANVLHRQDRHVEALRLYTKARQHFESQDNELAVAFCAYNEANSLVQLMQFDFAAELYERAERSFAENNYDLFALECRYGMAWLGLLRGNYHESLQGLVNCEESYRAVSNAKGAMLCQLDRAEVYLCLNLYTDALAVAKQALAQASKLKIHYESAKASFFAGLASQATGNERVAVKYLKRAQSGFEKENNESFLAVVQLTVNALQNGNHSLKLLNTARRKFERADLPLWEAICDLQLLRLTPESNEVWRRLRYNRAVRTVPHLFAHYHTLLGDRQATRGRLSDAKQHWTRAIEALEAVRGQLPPFDLRPTFLRNRTDPYRSLIQTELKDNPERSAVWSERLRCAGIWSEIRLDADSAQLRTEVQEGLEELAQRVTSVSSRLHAESGKRLGAPNATPYRRLEEKIRLALSRLESPNSVQDGQNEALIERFHDYSRKLPIVQFARTREDLIALVHEDGATRYHQYAGGVQRLRQIAGCWQLLLSRELTTGKNGLGSRLRDEDDLFRYLGDWLWSPLEIEGRWKQVLIIPDGELCNLPWSAIISGEQRLYEQHHLHLVPSLRHFIRSDSRRIRSRRIELFVGNTEQLSGVGREAELLRGLTNRNVTVHQPCRRADWPVESRSDVWHYTGHALMRTDNPFYSALLLDDGPLFAADFRMQNNRVNLVTLAACRTGRQVYMPGEESSGLVRSLLEMGARTVLASLWDVSDVSTSDWMREFYTRYSNGSTIALSYRSAIERVREDYHSAFNWAAFAINGAC